MILFSKEEYEGDGLMRKNLQAYGYQVPHHFYKNWVLSIFVYKILNKILCNKYISSPER
jgi:hypothetical protein